VFDLKGRVAIVTGGNGGIGLGMARGLARAGARIVIAARMRSMETFQVLMQFLLMPLFMLSGAIFPLRNLPAWMNVLVHLDPVTYGIDPLRQIVLRPSLSAEAMSAVALYPIPLDLAIIGGFACLMIALAVWAFNTQE